MPFQFQLDGRQVEVDVDGSSLLEVLRDRLGARTAKDGCSPQGQCGCCTVLVDGAPRVACVTPARRVAGREVTTLDGLPEPTRTQWADALCATGGSQCGFCTPGIIVRLTAAADVEQALLAHLCRCTGWRTIVEAAARVGGTFPARDLDAASQRATIEGGVPQRVGPEVALGEGGFADDTAPADALVAVPDGRGGWAVGETLGEARAAAGKVQGRRTTIDVRRPLDIPPGEWDAAFRTTWVEPAYLEPDASWCVPGGEPYTALANGGAFGGKADSPASVAARELADRYGRPVRVLLAREDVVRLGAKRPPVAGGARRDGTGVLRVVRTPGIAEAIAAVAPGLVVEEVDVAGPPTSAAVRAAGWAEAAVLLAGARGDARIVAPNGARAEAEASADKVRVRVAIPENDAAWTDRGDKAVVVLRAMRGQPIEGQVSRISRRLDTDTRTMNAEIDLENAAGQLLPGMYGEATITLDEREALVLPAGAVRFDEEGKSTVYVVGPAGKVSLVEVQTGLDDGRRIEIASGLDGDERVIATPNG
ncbi:MAG: efflux RND transporter periplasmic adaptor subunit, partial [Actinobacteria bacterium]|nr:efflux RND transporter periplasmic adaptor subunit [Actinomycetota bacterium]